VEAKQVKSQNDRLAIEDGMALEKVVDRLQPPIIHYTWEQTWNPQCSRLKSARRKLCDMMMWGNIRTGFATLNVTRHTTCR